MTTVLANVRAIFITVCCQNVSKKKIALTGRSPMFKFKNQNPSAAVMNLMLLVSLQKCKGHFHVAMVVISV